MPQFRKKLGNLFALGFILALLLPVLFLAGFAYSSLQSRATLVKMVVSENQKSQVQALESHFRNQMLKAYQDTAIRATDSFVPIRDYVSAQTAVSVYYEKYLPRLGIPTPEDSLKEAKLPVRLQLLRPKAPDKLYTVQELLNSLEPSSATITSPAGLLEMERAKTSCVVKFQPDCQHILRPIPWYEHNETNWLKLLELRKKLLFPLVKLRLLWQEKQSEPDQVRHWLDLAKSACTELYGTDCPKTVASFLRESKETGLGEYQWRQLLEEADPFLVSYYSLARVKRAVQNSESRLRLEPYDGLYPRYLLSGREARNLKEDLEWSSVNSTVDKIRSYYMLQDLGISNWDEEFIGYLGISLDLRLRRWRLWYTNTGAFLFHYWYSPLSYEPEEFFAGIAPMSSGLFFAILKLSELKLHYFKAMQIVANDEAKSVREDFLDLRMADPAIVQAYQSLWDLRDRKDAHNALNENRSVLDLGKDYFSLSAYLLGLRQDSPTLKTRSLLWQIHTDLKVLAVPQAILDDSKFPESEIAGIHGEHSEPLPEAVVLELRQMLREKRNGSVDYEFVSDGQAMLGLAVRSPDFSDHFLFLSLPRDLAYSEIRSVSILLLVVILLTIVITVILIRRLSLKIVHPVNELTVSVSAYATQETIKPLQLQDDNEIAQMARDFDIMVKNIDTRVMELGSVNQLNEMMLHGKELSDLLDYASDCLIKIFDAEFAWLGFYEQASREKFIGSSIQTTDRCNETRQDLQFRLKPLALKNAQAHLLYDDGVLFHGIHHDNVEGFLILGNPSSNQLSPEHEKFILSFTSQTVSVVAKVWLDKLKKDSVEGRDIQLGILPQEPLSMPGISMDFAFGAAKFLGGDFFDFVEYGDSDEVGFVISDVSGKGVGASLFGATCKAFLQSLSSRSEKPGDLMIRLNDLLCEGKSNTLFATLFFGILNTKTRVFRYASAGHNKMFVIRYQENKIEYLNAKGLPLGMFSPGFYESKEVLLNPNDWLFLYTDGVTELENPALELYGMDRLERLLLDHHKTKNPQEIKAELEKDMFEFRDGVDPSDDITYIAIKIEEI